MLFSTDKQTLEDLNIFGKHGADSVYSIFNYCSTRGGAAILKEMFRYPLSEDVAINKRISIIQFFHSSKIAFPFSSELFDSIEPYIANIDERTKLSVNDQSVVKKLGRMIAVDTETAIVYKGVQSLVGLLQASQSFITSIDKEKAGIYTSELEAIQAIISELSFGNLMETKGKLSHGIVADLDVLFRFRNRDAIQKLLIYLYQLDVYISIAKVVKARGLAFPKALSRTGHVLKVEGVFHLQVPNAVGNDISISSESNLIFLTGANMAGKSTFMKSLAISVFLAHMGFPVPAKKMEFSVFDGIYTTINLPDNLGMGASHFYAEVLRVKKIATELQQGKQLFIVFDELFRGTNVKDAYEATVAIIKGLAAKRKSFFVISTHIIEAGEDLKKECSNIRFMYLPTRMNGKRPVYTYRLEPGITDDRHGMVIVNNEGILDILEHGQREKGASHGFMADKQTLEDLHLLGRFKPHSIYSLFNKVKTHGGQRVLEQMFHQPLSDAAAINQRSSTFRYFQELAIDFPFQYEAIMLVEQYLDSKGPGNIISSATGIIRKKIMRSFLRDDKYNQLHAGLIATIDTLNKLKEILKNIDVEFVKEAKVVLIDKRLSWIASMKGMKQLSLSQTAEYDLLLRHTLRKEMEIVRLCLYQLDVHIAVSNIAREQKFTYANALPSGEDLIQMEGLWHPSIQNAVSNTLVPQKGSNILFLTGANMAGKSTFMKSFGIAIYLAHMGFPVAASEMQFSVRDGLFSSINVADDLNKGYSHFYAEVLRVKTVAEQVSQGKNLIVIFDELFKGTNVKDAFDATQQVTTALSKYKNCFFIISTHIVEVGEELRKGQYAVEYVYLPTIMEGNSPRYTYRLANGISSDKHGMLIIKNEKILETLSV